MTRPSPTRRSTIARQLVGLCLVAGLTFGPGTATPAAAQVVPLGGPTEVTPVTIAQGVAGLDDDIAWRVVRAEAAPSEDQDSAGTSTGFVIAGADGLLVSDLDTSVQTLLDGGEATWIAGGTEQQRAALGDDAVTYTEISLVGEADARDAGGGDLILGGDGFAAPDGQRKVVLREATLADGQSVAVPATDGEAAVLVATGQVEVSTGGDLAGGDAQSYADDVILTNAADADARVLIAAIGAVVPPLPTFTGSATLEVRACPPGTDGSSFTPSDCDPVDSGDGFDVSLLDGTYSPVATDDPFTDGERTWTDLPFGTYPWGAPTLPAPYVGTLWTDTDSQPLDIAQAEISADTPDVTHILYVFPVTTGSISVSIANCPAGVRPDDLATATCDEPVGTTTSLTLTTPDGDRLDAGDATVGGGAYQFTDLPVDNDGGVYTVDQPNLPSGYDDYLIVSGGTNGLNDPLDVALTSTNSAISVTVFNFRPTGASASPSAGEDDDGSGSITLQVVGCPPGVARGDSASYGQCTALVGGASVVLVTPSGATLTSGGPAGVYTFTGLAFGTYSLGLTGLPSGYAGAVAPGYDTSAASAARVNVTVSSDNPTPTVTVLVFQ